MAEQLAAVGDIELCYETFGDPEQPAMLLIMGLGTQMIAWHDDFCAELAGRGFHVVRFDNRDIGRSTKLSHIKPPSTLQLVLPLFLRRAPREREAFAADAVVLFERIGSPGYPPDAAEMRERAMRSYDR